MAAPHVANKAPIATFVKAQEDRHRRDSDSLDASIFHASEIVLADVPVASAPSFTLYNTFEDGLCFRAIGEQQLEPVHHQGPRKVGSSAPRFSSYCLPKNSSSLTYL